MPSRDGPSCHRRLRRASRPKPGEQFLPIGVRDLIAVEIGHNQRIRQPSRLAPPARPAGETQHNGRNFHLGWPRRIRWAPSSARGAEALPAGGTGRAIRHASPPAACCTHRPEEKPWPTWFPTSSTFPTRSRAVRDVEIGRVAGVGTEILDGWVVDEIKSIEETIDDKAVSYEVWVRPKLTH